MENAEQIDYWNGPGAQRWVGRQKELDRAFEPFGRAALLAAAPQPGERVLDVGCGCGWSSLELADAVGSTGVVLGVDVSSPMLALARERATARGLTHTTFTVADASTQAFELSFDLLFSRFGVMFFRDAIAAFAHLRTALRPGGRVAFVCWAAREDNPWYRVPMVAAGTIVPLPEATGPEEPGPFSLADPARLERVLARAGFTDVAIAPSSPDFVLGEDLETSVSFALDAGPLSRLLLDVDDVTRARVRSAVRQAIAPELGPRGVVLPASTWVVQARRR